MGPHLPHRALQTAEILDIVFADLDAVALNAALRTCKAWLRSALLLLWRRPPPTAFMDSRNWDVHRLVYYLGVTRSLAVPLADARAIKQWEYPKVRELAIDRRLARRPDVLLALLSRCGPLMSSLRLRGQYGPDLHVDDAVRDTADASPNAKIEHFLAALAQRRCVTKLDSTSIELDEAGIAHVHNAVPNAFAELTEVWLGVSAECAATYFSLLAPAQDTLTSLSVFTTSGQHPASVFEAVAGFRNLACLHLTPSPTVHCGSVSAAYLLPLRRLTQLRTLKLMFFWARTDAVAFSDAAWRRFVGGWPLLRELRLLFGVGVTPQALPILGRACPQLRHLRLRTVCDGNIHDELQRPLTPAEVLFPRLESAELGSSGSVWPENWYVTVPSFIYLFFSSLFTCKCTGRETVRNPRSFPTKALASSVLAVV